MWLDLDCVSSEKNLPDQADFELWAQQAGPKAPFELSIRVVDEAESQQLNETYRQKSGPTNILSFPCEVPPGVPNHLLGDLVICAPVVVREAREQGKPEEAHWAHLVVHGVLHLRGYDHIAAEDQDEMETLEIEILAGLGYPNPYLIEADAP